MADISDKSQPAGRRACPLCGAPTEPEFRPFCSRGCRDRDLIGWFDEHYAIPAEPVHPEADRDGTD